jgi:RNA polymerase sigma-70 factor (ECF subfamily)
LNQRVQLLVEQNVDFVWRNLRSLGVPPADCDDGCQKVWWVVARKLSGIEPGKERSFIFSVVVRVASDMRRSEARKPEATSEVDLVCQAPGPEELYEQRRARTLLESLLEGMPWDQRVVFVMYELEGLNSVDIARALELPRGTVASRLRLGRKYFERVLGRYQQRTQERSPVGRQSIGQRAIGQRAIGQRAIGQRAIGQRAIGREVIERQAPTTSAATPHDSEERDR